MKTLREADVRPLDLILFRGVDPVSRAIQFVQNRKIGRGDYSHAAVVVTREVLDLECLEPGKIYVWESVISASEGFWANFTDQVPAVETKGVRFGVQLRELELVIPGYMSDGGRVSWCGYRGERPPLEEIREGLRSLHEEFGHAPYTKNLLNVFGVIFPELQNARDRLNRAQSRVTDLVNGLLERSRNQKRVADADHHVFCSEWVARVYGRLGILEIPDPRLAAPVHFLTRTRLFDQPELLVPEGFDTRSLDTPSLMASERGASAHGARARTMQAAFLRHHSLQERLREYAAKRAAAVSVSDDKRITIEFRDGASDDERDAERWLDEQAGLELRRSRAPLAFGVEPPHLNVAILVTGTRGDVEPFIAIGQRLAQDGHRVRLATHAELRDLVESNGLEFYPLGGDARELTAYMVGTGARLLPAQIDQLADIIESTWDACTEKDPGRPDAQPFEADAIISSPSTHGHYHVAEALHVPLQIVFTMPWSPTRALPHPMANLDFERGRSLKNWLSYGVVDALTWAGTSGLIGRFRKKLGLPRLGVGKGAGLLNDDTVPFCYLWSPSLVPRPDDWADHIDVADFVFFEQASDYTPPDNLVAFLEAGDPPIYVGFGSCALEDAEGLRRTIFDALAAAGARGIVSADWGGLGGAAPPEHVHLIDECPHDWLFPRCAAVCHHGGAGTTASGLRAGRPTVVVPFFGDQPFWGAMVANSGAGPKPIPIHELDVERLAGAFRACEDPAVKARAVELGETLRSRDGAALAVKAFYRHLPTTADGMLSYVGFDPKDRERLRAGEIVTLTLQEGRQKGLAFAVAARIERPLEEVYEACLAGRAVEFDPRIRAFGALGDRDATPADFEAAGYGPGEEEEVAALLRARPDGPFNLSAGELERFEALGRRFPEPSPSNKAIDAVNEAIRDVLFERYRAYRSAGLDGIAPYVRAGGTETRLDEMHRVSLAPDSLLMEEFPDFGRALLDYPKSSAGTESRFYWINHKLSDHPGFNLTHHLFLPGEDFAAVSARTFFVSRDVDGFQILVGLARQGDETLLFSSQRMSSEQLAGILRDDQRKDLRAEMEAAARGIIEALRKI